MQGLFRGGEVDSGENFMVGHVSPLGDLLRRVDLEPIHTRLLDKVSNEKGGEKTETGTTIHSGALSSAFCISNSQLPFSSFPARIESPPNFHGGLSHLRNSTCNSTRTYAGLKDVTRTHGISRAPHYAELNSNL